MTGEPQLQPGWWLQGSATPQTAPNMRTYVYMHALVLCSGRVASQAGWLRV
jgi:hypothetical protein